MNSDDSINRDALLILINLVKPALSTQDYIPALKHILFANGFASAYNDAAAIQIALPTRDLNLDLCLPGDMLGKALSSFNAEKVLLQLNDKDGSLVIAAGRARIKVKTLPSSSYPLELPKGKAPRLALSDEILAGIRRCLMSVGNNPHHPAGMGVTLDVADGLAVLYSTDNATISRYQTKSKLSLPGDSPVILPTFFCEQLVSLAKALPKTEIDLAMHAGALLAEFFNAGGEVEARLFSKTLTDMTPLDFPRIVAKHCDVAKIIKQLEAVPVAFDAAFDRALLVMGAEVDKFTKVTPGDGVIKLLSTGADGEASDSIAFEPANPGDPFNLDPTLIARASKNCTHLVFANRVVVFSDSDGRFLHLVSHCSN